MSLKEKLKDYHPLFEALTKLFHPFVEIAVHDIKKGKLVALYHGMSNRKIGEKSHLTELKVPTDEFPDYFIPFYKHVDGLNLKCTSITIRDDRGRPIGLVCINFDTSFMENTQKIINTFLKVPEEGKDPVEMFGENAQEKIEALIDDYQRKKGITLERMSRSDKKKLANYLYDKGVFSFKNAVTIVAQILNVTRATVYNYLKSE